MERWGSGSHPAAAAQYLERLLRVPRWAGPSVGGEASIHAVKAAAAVRAAASAVSAAEADLVAVEEAILREGAVRDAPSLRRLAATSLRYRHARLSSFIAGQVEIECAADRRVGDAR